MLVILAVAFILRVVWQYHIIFVNGAVQFREVDPYLQMRLAENMSANWPHFMTWDYYSLYPNGAAVGYGIVLPFIISTVSLITHINVDVVGEWMPVILGLGVIVAVYYLGKEVFNKWVGLLSAGIVAFLPTEFLHRSMLGFTDNHVLEVLFSVLVLLFIIKAIRTKQRRYSIIAGVVMALFFMEWIGASILPVIILGWYLVSTAIKSDENRNDRIFEMFLTCGILGIVYFIGRTQALVPKADWFIFIGGPVIPIFAVIVKAITDRFTVKNLFRYVIIASIAVAAVIFIANPSTKQMGIDAFNQVLAGGNSTISEAQPVDFWGYFTIYGLPGFLAFVGIALCVKMRNNSLFLAWSIFWLIAMVVEKRWGYYGTIPVAMLSAYVVVRFAEKAKKEWRIYAAGWLIILIVAFSFQFTMRVAESPNDITPDWYNTLTWLRENSPEPYQTDQYLNGNLTTKPQYGVLSWWDYGHWIIQVA